MELSSDSVSFQNIYLRIKKHGSPKATTDENIYYFFWNVLFQCNFYLFIYFSHLQKSNQQGLCIRREWSKPIEVQSVPLGLC